MELMVQLGEHRFGNEHVRKLRELLEELTKNESSENV
jgi:hypothetical protein